MKRVFAVLVLCAVCSSTLFGQNPPRELDGTVESLLGDWESIMNDGSMLFGMPVRDLRTLTFRQSGAGTLHVTEGWLDVNGVLPGNDVRFGALVREYDLQKIEQGVGEFRRTGGTVRWKFGAAKIDGGLTKSAASNYSRLQSETGFVRASISGDYLLWWLVDQRFIALPKGSRPILEELSNGAIYRRGGGNAKLLALNAGLKRNTPHDPQTAAYLNSVERGTDVGSEVFRLLTGVDIVARYRRNAQEANEMSPNVLPPPPRKSTFENVSDLAGAVAAGLNQAQEVESARQQAAAQQQAEVARQQAAAQRQAEVARQQAAAQRQAESARQQRTSSAGGSAVNPVPRCVGPGCYWDGNRCRSELGGGTCTVGATASSPQSSPLPGSLSNGSAPPRGAAQQQAEIARQQQTPSVPESEKTAPFSCIVFGKEVSLGILENRCAFKIDVYYCVEKGNNMFRCDKSQFGSFTIAANGAQTTAYSPSYGRLYALVCRVPYGASEARWDGTNIVGTCR